MTSESASATSSQILHRPPVLFAELTLKRNATGRRQLHTRHYRPGLSWSPEGYVAVTDSYVTESKGECRD